LRTTEHGAGGILLVGEGEASSFCDLSEVVVKEAAGVGQFEGVAAVDWRETGLRNYAIF
jgi:hypothetical protein